MSFRLLRVGLSAFAFVPAGAQPLAELPKQDVVATTSTLDVPIEVIAASVHGCAVLDKDFPRLREHPMYGFFKSMSLNQIAALSHGKITPDMLAQARADLSALSFGSAAKSDQPLDFEDPVPPGNQASLSHIAPK